MGLKSKLFGQRPLKLDHLLNGKIDLERKGSLGVRIDFAWSAYTGNNAEKYKTAALNFLIKSFKLPPTSPADQLQKIQALMALKAKNPDKNVVPALSDIPLEDRLKLTKLSMLQAPPPPPPKPSPPVLAKPKVAPPPPVVPVVKANPTPQDEGPDFDNEGTARMRTGTADRGPDIDDEGTE